MDASGTLRALRPVEVPILREFLIIFALILLNGLFAAAELAVISLRRSRLAELGASKDTKGRVRAVQELRRDPERFLATVQIGVTVVSAAAAAFAGERVTAKLAGAFTALGGSPRVAEDAAFVSVVGMVSFLSLVFGELVPKSLALRFSERYALRIGRPLLWLARVAAPLVWLLTRSSNVVLRLFKDRTTFTESRITADELRFMIEEAMDAGVVSPTTGELASRAFEVGKLRVEAVMVPRPSMIVLPESADGATLRRTLQEHPHARFPVVGDDVDRIRGYVRARDLYARLSEGRSASLRELMHPAHFVSASMFVVDALREMQREKAPMAIVIDEQGGVSGLVTVEDLVEELVGEILNERENGPEEKLRTLPDGTVLVHGSMPVRDVNRAFGLKLPEGRDFTTMGGLATVLAGEIPAPGRELQAGGGVVVAVEEATPRKVLRLRVVLPPRDSMVGAAGA